MTSVGLLIVLVVPFIWCILDGRNGGGVMAGGRLCVKMLGVKQFFFFFEISGF